MYNTVCKGYADLLNIIHSMYKGTALNWGKVDTQILISFFVFSMGVQTIMQMASLFGTKEIERVDEHGRVAVVGVPIFFEQHLVQ